MILPSTKDLNSEFVENPLRSDSQDDNSLCDEFNITDNSTDISLFFCANDSHRNVTFSSDLEYYVSWTDVLLVTVFCCIIAGTVIGNTLVITAVATTRRLRTVTNCFVMSLAVADWLVGMFVMPPKVVLYLVDNEWRLGSIFCELWISLDIWLCTASILSLCAISIDRYLAITRPLAYSRRRRSKRLALSMISCVWIAAVLITIPPTFGWYDSNRNTENKCEYISDRAYVIYSALGSFFLPLTVMLYVYGRIACVIAQRQKSITSLQTSSKSRLMKGKTECRHMSQSLSVEMGQRYEFHYDPGDTRQEFEETCLSTTMGRNPTTSRESDFSQDLEDAANEEQAPYISKLSVPIKKSLWQRLYFLSRLKKRSKNDPTSKSNKKSRETGSRLCNHSLDSPSPHGLVMARHNSTPVPITTLDGLALDLSPNKRTPAKVWTVEDSGRRSISPNRSVHLRQITVDVSGRKLTPYGRDVASSSSSCIQSPSTSGHYLKIPSVKHQSEQQSRPSSRCTRSKTVKSVEIGHYNGNIGVHRESTGRLASFRRETKTAQTLAAVVGGFIICWLPFFLVYVSGPFVSQSYEIPSSFMDALIWLGWSNSTINPFIYAFYSADFRSAFWRLTFYRCRGLARRWQKKQRQQSPRRCEENTVTKGSG